MMKQWKNLELPINGIIKYGKKAEIAGALACSGENVSILTDATAYAPKILT